jgi:hypothetical protein
VSRPAHPLQRLDPDRSNIILCIGRKGSGKSHAAESLWHSYPHDALVVDVTGDAHPAGVETISAPLPERFPHAMADTDGTVPVKKLRWVPDPGSPTYRDDLDRAVGMVLQPRDKKALIWVDDAGELTTGAYTGPHTRRLLMMSRHHDASAIFTTPRPKNIDPLMLAQADYVFVFDLPSVLDRQRVAETIGYPSKRFSDELDATRRRGEHYFLLWSAREAKLYRCPPLPRLPKHVQARSVPA